MTHTRSRNLADHQVSETSLDNYAYCYYTVQNAHLFSQPAHNDNKPKKETPQQTSRQSLMIQINSWRRSEENEEDEDLAETTRKRNCAAQ
jgi:hypothetical protein